MRWYGCAEAWCHESVEAALGHECPGSTFRWMDAPQGLREALRAEMPGTSCAVVGPLGDGPSAINVAAALVHDGHAGIVALAEPRPSGSLRSRATQAGINLLVELGDPPEAARPSASGGAGEGSSSRGEGVRAVPGGSPNALPRQAAQLPEERGEGLEEVDGVLPRASARRPYDCPVLCVASGRGGVGKSTLACAMAVLASRWGMRVALCDFDLACGNDFSYFGLPSPAGLDALGEQGEGSDKAIASCGRVACPNVSLWGPCERPENAELVGPHAASILRVASSQADLVVVDAATAWTDAVAQAAQTCDRLLLVNDTRAGAVGSLSRAGGLAVRLGVARTRIVRVVNRCDVRRRGDAFINRADVGLETARTFRIAEGGGEVAELLAGGHVAEAATLEGEFSQSVESCLAQILQELGKLPDTPEARRALEVGSKPGRHGIFGRRREAV